MKIRYGHGIKRNSLAVLLTPLARLVYKIFVPILQLQVGVVLVGLYILKTLLHPIYAMFQKTPAFPWLLEKLTVHRGWVVLFVCLPLSFLYDLFYTFRNWYYSTFLATPELHEDRVRYVQEQVRKWDLDGRKKPMCTARAEWLTMSPRTATFKKDCNRIDLNGLRDILEIDLQRRTIRLEPLVDMGQITRHLLPLGHALKIMVEMEDLTIGGLVMGLGMEVNSHKYGLIQETVVAYEIVLSNGDQMHVTRDSHPDLFQALPWSHGTIGFLVSVEVEIIPVKPYMHMKYIPCYNQKEMVEKLTELSLSPNTPEMLEATIYSRNRAIIMCGEFADVTTEEQRKKINPIGRWYKPWFYKHCEEFFRTGEGEEYLPLRDYYHRHTKSIFWELEDMIPFGNHPIYRYLLGWLGAPKIAFLKLTMTPTIRQETITKHVVQDIIIPITELENSINKFHEWFGIYPLLFYPIRIYDNGKYQGFLRKPENCAKGQNWEMFFDLGVYGVPPLVKEKKPYDAVKAVRSMEKYTRDVKGYQCLYADIFLSKDEFEEMVDHTLYREMRKKYKAEKAFPEVYDKVKLQV